MVFLTFSHYTCEDIVNMMQTTDSSWIGVICVLFVLISPVRNTNSNLTPGNRDNNSKQEIKGPLTERSTVCQDKFALSF